MRVVFRHRPAGRAPDVGLRGDMRHWNHPMPMRHVAGGWHEASVDLPVGVYEYKFRYSDAEWALDPLNPRTRSRNGQRNNLLVIGGTDEPLVHAPVRPWVCAGDDGHVFVRAALRVDGGAGERVVLRWNEGDGWRRTPMRVAGREDEHILLEARLPGAGTRLDYLFETGDGRLVGASGCAGQAFRVTRKSLVLAAPEWWRDAVVYTVFVDRFRRGGAAGTWRDPTTWRRTRRAGGDLYGVAEALPYLRYLGVDVLHLTPICVAPSVHRYDCVAPRRVDPALGGEVALLELIARAHDYGIRVLVDVTVTHVHRDFFAFRDVAANGASSRYWDWFRVYSHPFSQGDRPGYLHYQKGQWQEPLLDTDNPEVVDYLAGTVRHWARTGVDGVRIDAAADVPPRLVRRLERAVRSVNRDAVVFGEVVPDNTYRWTGGPLDAATDFAFAEALHDWLWRGARTAAELAATCAQRRFVRGGPGWTALSFTATHDQPRLLTRTGDSRVARLGLLVVLLRETVPMLYYGDEVGLESSDAGREFEDSWPDRMCMPWIRDAWDLHTLALVREAIALRRARAALSRGDERELDLPGAGDDVFAFRRSAGAEAIDVIVHRGTEPVTLAVDGWAGKPLLTVGDAKLDRSAGTITLGAWSAIVLDRSAPEPDIEIVDHNAALARRAFREGMIETPSLPTKLYVTVTESCNLRCRHCITGAPARTREGRARTIRPWVVDALGEAFAATDYVAFTHGGESLVSPMLPVVLEAIGRARSRRPGRCDIHLATNGMLLSPDRTRELADLGVNSVMVSIDGATAATNDAIRAGADLDRILANVRAAVAFRESSNRDLRIGISTVVGRTNVSELAELGRIARDLGVDWLKIEETYEATGFARADFLRPSASPVRHAVRQLRAALADAPVVLVDHLDPPAGCRCETEGQPVVRAFRDADDFANRTRFAPCRAAWEIACIDPDGSVHPVDYFHASAGSLADAPLQELWNGPVVQAARARAAARCAAGRRDRCAAL